MAKLATQHVSAQSFSQLIGRNNDIVLSSMAGGTGQFSLAQ
jgi:hypothetical protein